MRLNASALALAFLFTACIVVEDNDDDDGNEQRDDSDNNPDGNDTDANGNDSDTDEPEPDLPPTISIVAPEADEEFVYDGFDSDLGLWYADVTLTGTATDPEDGVLSGASLMWSTDRSDLQDAALGNGTEFIVRLYSDDCFGVNHVITLTVVDGAGNEVSESVTIRLWTLC